MTQYSEPDRFEEQLNTNRQIAHTYAKKLHDFLVSRKDMLEDITIGVLTDDWCSFRLTLPGPNKLSISLLYSPCSLWKSPIPLLDIKFFNDDIKVPYTKIIQYTKYNPDDLIQSFDTHEKLLEELVKFADFARTRDIIEHND